MMHIYVQIRLNATIRKSKAHPSEGDTLFFSSTTQRIDTASYCQTAYSPICPFGEVAYRDANERCHAAKNKGPGKIRNDLTRFT